MNILFFSDNFPPEVNAIASRVFERACYWIDAGHSVTVITSAPNFPQGKIYPGYKNKWYQEENMNGIRVIRVKTFMAKNEGIILRTLDFISYFFTATHRAIFLKKPDVIMATSPQFFAAIAGWLTAKFKSVPFVLEISDLWPASITAVGAMKENFLLQMFEKLELFLYRKATAIVALTHSIKQDLVRRKIPSEKISVIINGVDLSKYSPQSRDENIAKEYGLKNEFTVGYIGTHGLAQGLENVLEAAKLLREETDLKFLFVGAGAAKEKLMQQTNNENLKNVIFIPPQPKDKMPLVWSLCTVALVHLKNVPLFEGVIPSKMFEAMGMGLPLLLVSPEGEASAIVTKTQAGIWVSADDPLALAKGILDYKNNKSWCQEIARNSENAAIHYTRERQANDFLNVLENLKLIPKPVGKNEIARSEE